MTAELKDDAPIPPEINKYLAILSKDPGSMVFAPLAEAYRKIGMLDEAIATAQDGLKLHPNYVSGMVALGRAYFEKGALAEARETLETVLVIAPDNIVASNILDEIKSKWSGASGQKIDEPETEELIELEELTELTEIEAEEETGDFQVEEISFDVPEPGLGLAKEEEEVKVQEELDGWGDEAASELEEELGVTELFEPEAQVRSLEVEEKEARPRKEITTGTIADLYIKQGYFDKAIDIYQTLYDSDPENDEIKRKLDELKMQGPVVCGQGSEIEIEEQEHVKEQVKEQEEVKEEVKSEIEELGVGWAEPAGQGAELKTDENITRLESWLKTIQSERRRG